MIIPHTAVSIDVLRAVIEEFVTREGTDYGMTSWSLDDKVADVLMQLEQRKAFLVFDAESESCDIVTKGSVRYRAALAASVADMTDKVTE